MKRLLALLVFGVTAAALPSIGYAAWVDATPIWTRSKVLRPGDTYRFETFGLTAGTSTVVHVFRHVGAGSDLLTNSASPPAHAYTDETVTIPSGGGSAVIILVRARVETGSPPGSCKLRITNLSRPGEVSEYDVQAYGGTYLNVAAGAPGMEYTFETQALPGGTSDPLIIGLDANGKGVAWDDDGGVGLGSRIAGVASIRHVIVGAAMDLNGASDPGPVALLANDVFNDHDGDGLGEALEWVLQTCDSNTPPECANVRNLRDSDGDGLSDMAEVFGIDNPVPQYLSRWGADPAHKDIFVEVDYWDTFVSQPVTEADAEAMRDYLLPGPASHLGNLDLSDGVRIHLDLGFNPQNPANITLFGDWGDSNSIPVGHDFRADRYPNRDGIFMHAVIAEGAQTSGTRFGVGLPNGSPRQRVKVFMHELGHTMSLEHEGRDWDWGKNCSPIYPSIMNYADSTWGDIGYSDGSLYQGVRLNPASLCELDGLGGYPVDHLAGFGIPTVGTSVDWNRDGVINDCSKPVRAAINWWPPSGCAAHTQNQTQIASGASPAIARMGSYMYIFFVDGNGTVQYARAIQSVEYREGGCPDGFSVGPDSKKCTQWSAPIPASPEIPKTGTVNAFNLDGRIYVTTIDPQTSIARVAVATAQASDGTLTSWGSYQLIPGATTTHAPELQLLYVDPLRYGTTRIVAAIWPNAANELEWAWSNPARAVSFTYAGLVRDTGGGIVGSNGMAPSMVYWGTDNGVGPSQTLLLSTDFGSRVLLYVYDPIADAWRDITLRAFPQRPTGTLAVQHAALSYRPLVDADGYVTDPWTGEFTLLYGATNEQGLASMWVSEVVSVTKPPDSTLTFKLAHAGRFGHPWYGVALTNGGFDLFTDPEFPYLKGAFVDANGTIVFLPHADGIYSLQYKSDSDYKLIERGLCMSLRRDTNYCGTANQWGY